MEEENGSKHEIILPDEVHEGRMMTLEEFKKLKPVEWKISQDAMKRLKEKLQCGVCEEGPDKCECECECDD